MDKQQLKLSIFGKNYIVSSTQDDLHVRAAAQLIDSLMKNAAKKMPNASHIQVSILTCLELAADLNKIKCELENFKTKTEQCTRIIEQELDN